MKRPAILVALTMVLSFFLVPYASFGEETPGLPTDTVTSEETPNENAEATLDETTNEETTENDTEGFPEGNTNNDILGDVTPKNIKVDNLLAGQFKYEKVLDMRNAKDRTKIPNVGFTFNLEKIDPSEYEKYGIGSRIDPPEHKAQFYSIDQRTPIVAGELETPSIPFSKVTFAETDHYDAKLTELMDNYASANDILNHILKHNYGVMKTGNRIETAFTRKPEKSDYEELGVTPDNWPNNWPKDTVGWRCFNDTEEVPGNGCQSLMDNDYNTFDYNKIFGLQDRQDTFYAYTYRRPLITHQYLDDKNQYLSVAKSLFNEKEYTQVREILKSFNPEYNNKIYRFILRETSSSDSNITVNAEPKIVDFYSDTIMVYNSVEAANAFYQFVFYAFDLPKENSAGSWGMTQSFSTFTAAMKLAPIVNSYKEIPRIQFKVRKDWKNLRGNIPVESVEIELYKNSTPTGIKKTLSKANRWNAIFENLEVNDDSGKPHTYSVKEIGDLNSKFISSNRSFTVSYEGDIEKGFVVTNTETIPNLPNTGYDNNVLSYLVFFLIVGAITLPISKKLAK